MPGHRRRPAHRTSRGLVPAQLPVRLWMLAQLLEGSAERTAAAARPLVPAEPTVRRLEST